MARMSAAATTVTVTTWYLEQRNPGELRGAAAPAGDVRIARAGVPSPEFSRFLYTAVGGDVHWLDRLVLTRAEWAEILAAPGVETWVAHEDGTPAGYAELAADGEGSVEIVYFGLLPAFRGRRIGGHLLAYAAARAWDMAERWPSLPATRRVWLHTCSLDGPYALENYRRRGFSLYDTQIEQQQGQPTPGPWPGACTTPWTAS
jgi:GNAT superfamily N-acetyltransferase